MSDDVSTRPVGWAEARLGDVLSLKYGKALPERIRDGNGAPVYGSNGVVGHHSAAMLAGPTIIVGRKGSIGAVHVSDGPCSSIDTTYYIDDFHGQPARFWYHLLRSLDLAGLNRATALPGLNREDAYDLPIRIPPVAEQRRIVAKLDELLASSRAARATLDEVPAMLEQYRQAVLAAAFRGDLTAEWRREHEAQLATCAPPELQNESAAYDGMPSIPSTWRYVPVEQVAQRGTVVTYGIVLPGPELPDGVPYVRQQDIVDGQIRVDALARTIPEIAAKHARSALQAGDVLLCIIRHLRVAVVPPGLDGANITQGTVRIRPASFINAGYLAAYLSAPAAQGWMKRCYIGMAMPRINVKDARAVPVAVPSLTEQHEIMRQVSAALAVVERQHDYVEELRRRLLDLENALLSKAFRGELVPQNPADESASVLLERIRAERPEKPVRRSRHRPART